MLFFLYLKAPNILINIDELNEETIGQLIYFFEKACAVSGMLLGIISIVKGAVPKAQIYVEPDFEEELLELSFTSLKSYLQCPFRNKLLNHFHFKISDKTQITYGKVITARCCKT